MENLYQASKKGLLAITIERLKELRAMSDEEFEAAVAFMKSDPMTKNHFIAESGNFEM